MNGDYAISLATPDDVAGILALQEPNLQENGGSLSVRQWPEWFKRAIAEKSLMVCRRNREVVGYVLGTSLAVKAHIPIIQSMLRAFPPPPDCYLYGPICIAKTERGNGLAGAMFKELQTHMDGRWECRNLAHSKMKASPTSPSAIASDRVVSIQHTKAGAISRHRS
jgi:hypothetical protein